MRMRPGRAGDGSRRDPESPAEASGVSEGMVGAPGGGAVPGVKVATVGTTMAGG